MAGLPVVFTGTVRNAGGAISAPAFCNINRFSITPGQEFATTAWCYQRLAPNAPLDPNSAVIANNFWQKIKPSGAVSILDSVPIWIMPANQPTVPVALFTVNPDGVTTRRVAIGEGAWSDQLISQFQAVPVPNDFAPASGSDGEAVIYQIDTHKLWEGWIWAKTGSQVRNSAGALVDEWSIRWGGHEPDLRTSDGTWAPQAPSGIKGGMAAAGIHWLSFTITLGDMAQQAINHPIGVVCPVGSIRSDVWNRPPAWRTDGYPPFTDPNYRAEGCIFRLPANINLDAYPVLAWDGVSVKRLQRLIAEAIRDYGVVLMDQGGGCVGNMEYGFTSQHPDSPPLNDPIISQVLGASHPWGYDNQYLQIPGTNPDPTGDFPWDKLQLLKMNLVSS
jgi:hypothetical protein